jgi:L-iditol 2-dehydrogenase
VKPGSVLVQEVETPRPGPGEVLVNVAACGICGSDVHGYRTGVLVPGCVIGHEYSGWVEDVGAGADGLERGDLVAGNSTFGCGECEACRRGQDNLCKDVRILGVSVDGAMARSVAVPASSLVKVEGGDPEELALSAPLSVALRAWRAVELEKGDPLVVTGAGPIGLLVLLLARYYGCENVVVSEPRPERAALAEALGATRVIDPRSERLLSAVPEGAGAVVECSGAAVALMEAPALVRARGRIIPVAIYDQPIATDYLTLMAKEIGIQPVFLTTRKEFGDAVDLISRHAVDVRPVISTAVELDAVPTTLEELADGGGATGNAAKVLVRPI